MELLLTNTNARYLINLVLSYTITFYFLILKRDQCLINIKLIHDNFAHAFDQNQDIDPLLQFKEPWSLTFDAWTDRMIFGWVSEQLHDLIP